MPDEHTLTELESGIRVVTERVPSVRSIAIGMWVRVGSRDESIEQAGISHFLEHMLFKGTPDLNAEQIAQVFDGFGAEVNAATSKETTVLHAHFLDEHLDDAFRVMSDMLLRSTYADMESEREVVLEEIAMYEDEPQDKVHDVLSRAIFGEHPLGRPVIGRGEVISSLSTSDVAGYHDDRYLPGSIVVAAAGNLEHPAIESLARQFTQPPKQNGSDPAGSRNGAGATAPAREVVFHSKETEQYHICLGGPGISRNDDRRFGLAILDAIIGGSTSSRLFQEVREKRGLAYAVYSWSSQYTDTGQVGIYVGTREDNLAEALAIAAEQIADIADGGLRESELERAKENLKGRVLLSMESTSTHMNRLGKALITDSEILSLERIVAEVDAVEPEAVAELAGLLLAPERLSAAGIGPNEDRFLEALEGVSPSLARAA